MCLRCGRFWTALQVLWCTVYVICGAAQLMAAIFFTISVPQLYPYNNIFAGSWNIIIGIGGGMVACIGMISPKRQEILLYLAISILAVNSVNVIITEWRLYYTDLLSVLNKYSNHVLIESACFVTRIAAATVLLVSFVDCQLCFCSMQTTPQPDKKLQRSHEQVSDIEYIIPRPKSSKPHIVNNAYSQSWVFEAADNATCSNNVCPDTNYIKVVQNGTPKSSRNKKFNNNFQNGLLNDTTHLIDNPVVHIEEASDDSTSNSDRKLCHMKSFSRSASPVILSASSSQTSLNLTPSTTANNNPSVQIYEYLEKLTEPTIYRSRLNTAVSNKDENEEEESHYQAPQAVMMRRVESVSPHAEKVQYASLMKELQRAIVCKKEPSSITSPQSTSESATTSEKTHSSGKNSDAEFSKELEAALQLIQDLESPNTIDTPSEPKSSTDGKDVRPLAVWRNSDASESEKTLSAVGSLAEIASPLNECQPELYTFKPSTNGKKGASVVVHYPDSQSTSGYSSPTHHSNGPTPNWSTTSSINGSNSDIIKPISYSIHNAKSTTVISLYTEPDQLSKGKSVTLVTISGNNDPIKNDNRNNIHSSTLISDYDQNIITPSNNTDAKYINNQNKQQLSPVIRAVVPPVPPIQAAWNMKSLLRAKKKPPAVPKLCPELEGAIIKSESLAYLSELELLARHQRNKEIQREIEERVIQQLGTPRTESNC